MKRPKKSTGQLNRRHFLKTTSLATGALAFGVPTLLRAQNLNSKLNIAAIGCGGKGRSDIECVSGENIVALCDVDENNARDAREKYPDAKFYRDFRVMLDEMDKSVDACMVSTPDHFHAIAASAVMQRGKHVYCQKPLTQTVYEARYLRKLAHEKKIVTQMGNQGSSADGLRRAVECLYNGIIGNVTQLHIWTNRPIWPQGMDRPEGSDPVPDTLDWDMWLGPAPFRPYKAKTVYGKKTSNVYEPFVWRGWRDFGTGAIGDMACHTVNMPFRGLGLVNPTSIEAQVFSSNPESYPIGSKIHWEFPAQEFSVPAMHANWFHRHDTIKRGPLTFWWYDGGQPLADDPTRHDDSNKPPQELTGDIIAFQGEMPGSGCLLIGDKGQIFSPDDYGEEFYIKLNDDKKFEYYKKHPAVAAIPMWLPRNTHKGGSDQKQHLEWIDAIKSNQPEKCYSRFDIAARLTETMVLGCVAIKTGKKIEWDHENMKAINCPEADPFIKRENRSGWTLA